MQEVHVKEAKSLVAGPLSAQMHTRLCRPMRTCNIEVSAGGVQEALVKKAKSLVVGNGADRDTDVGPLISPEAKERAVRLITEGIHQASGPLSYRGWPCQYLPGLCL